MSRRRFTGQEDRALLNIIEGRATNRIIWADVVVKLRDEYGFEERTQKSVRNRHLRRRRAHTEQAQGIMGTNNCRICGRIQKGHVCEAAIDTAAEPEEDSPPASAPAEVASGGEKE